MSACLALFACAVKEAFVRAGPILPVEPAALNVWQPPHPFAVKTFLPAPGSPQREQRRDQRRDGSHGKQHENSSHEAQHSDLSRVTPAEEITLAGEHETP